MQAIFISVFIILTSPYGTHLKGYEMTMQECLYALEAVEATIDKSRVTSIQGETAIYVGSACLPVFVRGEL